MHRRFLPFVALLLCAIFAAPAQADFRVGIGDQDPRMFDNANYQKLGIKRIRYLLPFDWYKHRYQVDEVTTFMNRAGASGAEVLVHFTAKRGCYKNGRYSSSKRCRAPSVKTFKRGFRRFRKAFPSAKTIGVWNEANHVSQPTVNNPRLAAKYFLAARKTCRSCTLVAADVLDSSNMESWLGRFRRKAGGNATIYGLHNYGDVNRRRSSGTRRLLRAVPGQVWLTETGGILKFLPSFKRSESRQANRTKYMFRLADKYDRRRGGMRSRITRLYNYQWTGVSRAARFDAGLVNADGSPRKAYRQFRKFAKRYSK
jgi:Glycosyl hydrolase catalytic core